ncbi:TlpA disulfide reductase family protein [Pelagibacterium montanilacus]|uniref:TlpA disulfide reductase family protein n=1 Tax=Pelagibacterium montanilacus TaxID=2185280 RepID=UPI000F8DB1CA|nr:TlpA disulfide reductase family protein [Pelagibacterium montanilacus]
MTGRTEPRRISLFVTAGVSVAALGIAAALWLSNAGTGLAQSCEIREDVAQTMDASAQGELAALLASINGRGYADLAFIDSEGNPLTLADFSGKKLLVNFWATWCAPCREEMPDLDALQARYGSEDFEVVAISLDMGSDGPVAADQFLEEIGADNLALYADPSYKVFERLRNEAVTLGLPATVLLDEEACEVAVLQGPAHWDSADGDRVIETLLSL